MRRRPSWRAIAEHGLRSLEILEAARTRTPAATRSITEAMLRLAYLELDDRSDNPAAPPAGRYRLFVKSGDLYGIDSDSNVTAY